MDNKLREIEGWAENIKLPYALRQLLHYSGDTIKRLTEEHEILKKRFKRLTETSVDIDEHHTLLRQKEDEIERLKTIVHGVLND